MDIKAYLRNLPKLHSWDGGKTWRTGGLQRKQLEPLFLFLKNNLPPRPNLIETGAGNSTIMMLFLKPARLTSIAPEWDLFQRIRAFCKENSLSDSPLDVHVARSELILPKLAEKPEFDSTIDFALIDGCHGWPTAMVDLNYMLSMLRVGGFLMIDDVQLHSAKEMARLLYEQPGFNIEMDLGKALVFQKTTAERSLGEWSQQPYIKRLSEEYARAKNPYVLSLFAPPEDAVQLTEQRVIDAEQRAIDAEQRLIATYNSSSWWITTPLRFVKAGLSRWHR